LECLCVNIAAPELGKFFCFDCPVKIAERSGHRRNITGFVFERRWPGRPSAGPAAVVWTDYFLWQFMHSTLPVTARPSTVVPGASLATHSMCLGGLAPRLARSCGSWQLVQPTASVPSVIARSGMMPAEFR